MSLPRPMQCEPPRIELEEQQVSRLVSELKDCRRNSDLKRGSEIHSEAISCGLRRNKYVVTSLIKFYAECGSIAKARQIFDESRLHHNVVAWNCLLFGYIENGESNAALELFETMESWSCRPCSRTFVAAITACANLASGEEKKVARSKWLEKGAAIHSRALKCNCCDMFVESALVDFYAKAGCMTESRTVFESMKQCDIVSWTALLQGYVDNGQPELALELYQELIGSGKVRVDGGIHVAALSACAALASNNSCSEEDERRRLFEIGKRIHSRALSDGSCNLFVESLVVNLFGRCGRMKDAREVFDGLLCRDVVCWNALLQGYLDNGEGLVVLKLFRRMQNEAQQQLSKSGSKFTQKPSPKLSRSSVSSCPNSRTYVVAISALAAVAATEGDQTKTHRLEEGRSLHSQAMASGCYDIYVKNALITMYSQCRSPGEAREVFESTADGDARDVVSWNAMITGLLDNGDSEQALDTVAAMDAPFRDSRTYVAALMACTNLLAVETGRAVHAGICCKGFEKCVAVSNSLLDLYSKAGSFEAAVGVFDAMVERSAVSWNSLMCNYSSQGDTGRVFELFGEMLELGVQADEVTFVCLLAACNHGGLVDAGKRLFDGMEERYKVARTVQHFNCMVDLLGRANRIDEAVRLARQMPHEGNDVTWRGILCACRKWNNVEVGKLAYEELVKLDGEDSSAYVILWRMLEATDRGDEKKNSLRVYGSTWWFDVAGNTHTFTLRSNSFEKINSL